MTPIGTERGWRRLIYVKQMRKQLPTHLENFDFPQMNPNCIERRDSTVAPQALHLMNNGMVGQLAEHFAERVAREAGAEPARGRARVPDRARAAADSGRIAARRRRHAPAQRRDWREAVSGAEAKYDTADEALTTFCHAIMNSAAFLYVD